MSNFIDLDQKYGLIFSYSESNEAMKKAVELVQKPQIKKEWSKKREKFLKDKINVTGFRVWFIENFPKSFEKMKDNDILG